ncbi:unnamed protein product, partial [Discosporangium mesarthrocarpum]
METSGVHGLHLMEKDSEEPTREDCHFRAAVGALLWASVTTRLDISNAVRAVAQYYPDPGRARWEMQRIMQCLLATS